MNFDANIQFKNDLFFDSFFELFFEDFFYENPPVYKNITFVPTVSNVDARFLRIRFKTSYEDGHIGIEITPNNIRFLINFFDFENVNYGSNVFLLFESFLSKNKNNVLKKNENSSIKKEFILKKNKDFEFILFKFLFLGEVFQTEIHKEMLNGFYESSTDDFANCIYTNKNENSLKIIFDIIGQDYLYKFNENEKKNAQGFVEFNRCNEITEDTLECFNLNYKK